MRRHLALAGFLAVVSLAAVAGDGIPMGNAVFYPSIEAVYTHTDNLYLQDSTMAYGNLSSYWWQVRPALGFEFPFKDSYVRLDLGYQYQDYGNGYEISTHNQYDATLKGIFRFSNGGRLTFEDNFIRGVQETTKFDPGYERYYSNTPFDNNLLKVGIDFDLNKRNSLGAYGLYNIVRFDAENDPNNPSPFFDFTQTGGGLLWKYHFRPKSALILDGRYLENSPDINSWDQWLYVNANNRKYDEFRAVTGWEGDMGSRVNGFARAGWARLRFHNTFSNYSGLVADVGLEINAAEFFKVKVDLFRTPYQSGYNVNNYYTSTGGELELHHQVSRYLFWAAGYRYQENAYPNHNEAYPLGPSYPTTAEYLLTAGQNRSDKISRAFAELGYHFNKQFSLRANYRYEDRNSSISYIDFTGYHRPYSYTENRLSLQAQFGW
jgi:hypothetical protein